MKAKSLTTLTLSVLLATGPVAPVWAAADEEIQQSEREFEEEADASDASANEGQYTSAQINEMINNPLGELWMLFLQNDTTWYDGDALDFLGEDKKIFNTTIFQPVMPFQLTQNWKWIFRPVIPLHYWEAPSISQGTPTHYPGGDLPVDVDFDGKFNLGDIVLWNAFATNEMAKPPNIFGFGTTTMLNTATDEVFGTGKWSAGPMALAFHIGPPGGWILGTVVQHWWDFAGGGNRSDVNLTNIQYVAFYRLTDSTNIGFGSPTSPPTGMPTVRTDGRSLWELASTPPARSGNYRSNGAWSCTTTWRSPTTSDPSGTFGWCSHRSFPSPLSASDRFLVTRARRKGRVVL